jgi:hypothetical protein
MSPAAVWLASATIVAARNTIGLFNFAILIAATLVFHDPVYKVIGAPGGGKELSVCVWRQPSAECDPFHNSPKNRLAGTGVWTTLAGLETLAARVGHHKRTGRHVLAAQHGFALFVGQ